MHEGMMCEAYGEQREQEMRSISSLLIRATGSESESMLACKTSEREEKL